MQVEALDPREIATVVGHDRIAPSRNGQLGDEVVRRISQQRSPQKEDVLLSGHAAEVIDEIAHISGGETGFAGVAEERILVFEDQRHGHGDVERSAAHAREDLEGRPPAGAHRGDQDVRIEHDQRHIAVVSYTIPSSRTSAAVMLIFAGYFPKQMARRDDWLKAPSVREIWSVSECLSKGPSDWIDHWRHNDRGLFDTEQLAESVVPADRRHEFTIVAYRLWDRMLDDGVEVPLHMLVRPVPGPYKEFVSVGFDSVALFQNSFACSPLSCNRGAEQFAVNERCLFLTFDAAVAGAVEFSRGNWEPGPYGVVEVLCRNGQGV